MLHRWEIQVGQHVLLKRCNTAVLESRTGKVLGFDGVEHFLFGITTRMQYALFTALLCQNITVKLAAHLDFKIEMAQKPTPISKLDKALADCCCPFTLILYRERGISCITYSLLMTRMSIAC